MTYKEMLDKYIKSCLNKEERKEVMDMLYRYKKAFSLRDELGTCPNIEVGGKVIMLGRKIRHLLIKKLSNYAIWKY